MSQNDIIVYAHRDGKDYVGLFGRDWWRWPAERDGWRSRTRYTPRDDEDLDELSGRLAYLALRLSGVEP